VKFEEEKIQLLKKGLKSPYGKNVMAIDKEGMRLLKYLYKKDGVKGEAFIKRKRTMLNFLYFLKEGLILCSNGTPNTRYDVINLSSIMSGEWTVSTKGCFIVEKASTDFWRWIVPLVFSALALIISIVNVIKAYSTPTSQEPIKVILTTLAPTIKPLMPPIPTLPPIFPYIP
jgi:hypothetical protein